MRYKLEFLSGDRTPEWKEYDVSPMVGDLLRFEDTYSAIYFRVTRRIFVDEHLMRLELEEV